MPALRGTPMRWDVLFYAVSQRLCSSHPIASISAKTREGAANALAGKRKYAHTILGAFGIRSTDFDRYCGPIAVLHNALAWSTPKPLPTPDFNFTPTPSPSPSPTPVAHPVKRLTALHEYQSMLPVVQAAQTRLAPYRTDSPGREIVLEDYRNTLDALDAATRELGALANGSGTDLDRGRAYSEVETLSRDLAYTFMALPPETRTALAFGDDLSKAHSDWAFVNLTTAPTITASPQAASQAATVLSAYNQLVRPNGSLETTALHANLRDLVVAADQDPANGDLALAAAEAIFTDQYDQNESGRWRLAPWPAAKPDEYADEFLIQSLNALWLQPASPQAATYAAYAREHDERPLQTVVDTFKYAIKLTPDWDILRLHLADIEVSSGRINDAIEALGGCVIPSKSDLKYQYDDCIAWRKQLQRIHP